MPLYIERLQKSRAWLICKRRPELAFYLMNLWMRAWHEVPAGSLEDDDEVLADAARISPTKWPKLRDEVLRGWKKGEDGRLYHAVLIEFAIQAYEQKNAQRNRTAAARAAAAVAARLRQLQTDVEDTPQTCDPPVTGSVTDTATETKGREVKGKKEREGKGQTLSAVADPFWLPAEFAEYEQHRIEKRSKLTPTARAGAIAALERWRGQGHDIVAILRYSIDNGYTGLFEPKGAGVNKQEALEQRNKRVAESWVPPEMRDGTT
jgi:uncharacterized protein YdaU (DUF1376 family)